MGFKCGIVGLPNVGKSTLFNALTKAGVEAANYPFCTIEPNVGVVTVPDPRLTKLSEIAKPQRTVPAAMQFVDIAGLVKGASKGQGLGNQFLAHIRETEAIVHVVRCFDNGDVIHVDGNVDPIRDIEVINTELALADLDAVDRLLQKAQKLSKSGDKSSVFEKAVLEKVSSALDQGQWIKNLVLDEKEQEVMSQYTLLTSKPVLYLANVNEDGFENNPYLDKVRAFAAAENARVVPVCAAIESEIASLDLADQLDFLQSIGLEEPGLNRLIRCGYELLNLQTYFTVGPKEVRAWTFHKGALAPQAAAVIHTDFEKGFIRAEVIAYDDFVANGGEQGAKEAGKLRIEGKSYVVQDGDLMHFLFNV